MPCSEIALPAMKTNKTSDSLFQLNRIDFHPKRTLAITVIRLDNDLFSPPLDMRLAS